MKVAIRKIEDLSAEQVIIECVSETQDVTDIKNYARRKDMALTGSIDGRMYQLSLDEIFYFEAVGEHLFAYTEKDVYEMKGRLYETEQA